QFGDPAPVVLQGGHALHRGTSLRIDRVERGYLWTSGPPVDKRPVAAVGDLTRVCQRSETLRGRSGWGHSKEFVVVPVAGGQVQGAVGGGAGGAEAAVLVVELGWDGLGGDVVSVEGQHDQFGAL